MPIVVQMYKKVYPVHGLRLALMHFVLVFMGLVSVLAVVGSVETIVAKVSSGSFKPFHTGN